MNAGGKALSECVSGARAAPGRAAGKGRRMERAARHVPKVWAGEPGACWGRRSRDALPAAAAFPHAEPLLPPAAVVSGTLVLVELQPAPEPGPEPEDGGKEVERGQLWSPGAAQPKGQHQASWKEESVGSPATTQEPGGGQSHRVEQPPPGQPSAGSQGSQVQNW